MKSKLSCPCGYTINSSNRENGNELMEMHIRVCTHKIGRRKMRYKLSNGQTGITTYTKEKFKEILLDGINIISWEENDFKESDVQ